MHVDVQASPTRAASCASPGHERKTWRFRRGLRASEHQAVRYAWLAASDKTASTRRSTALPPSTPKREGLQHDRQSAARTEAVPRPCRQVRRDNPQASGRDVPEAIVRAWTCKYQFVRKNSVAISASSDLWSFAGEATWGRPRVPKQMARLPRAYASNDGDNLLVIVWSGQDASSLSTGVPLNRWKRRAWLGSRDVRVRPGLARVQLSDSCFKRELLLSSNQALEVCRMRRPPA